MSKKQAYTIEQQPNWMYEAAACFSEMYQNNDEKVIENHSHFGMTKEEMKQYLAKYQHYKQKVMPEMKEMIKRYPKIAPLLIPYDDSNSVISSMYYYIHHLLENAVDCEIDEVICRFVKDLIVENATVDIDEAMIAIESVSDVIQLLTKANFDDKEKLNLISLYSDRYKLVPDILRMLRQGGAILEKYQDMIIEDHQASIQVLKQQDELNLIRLKMDLDIPTTVFTCIFPFNSISVQRKPIDQVIYMGMYVSYLSKQKEANRYQSEDVITALKALADPTRWKILSLLAKQPMYLQEIANAMDLSPATISHHVNMLVSSAFINIVFDAAKSKKVYYETNSKGLQDIATIISSFAKKEH